MPRRCLRRMSILLNRRGFIRYAASTPVRALIRPAACGGAVAPGPTPSARGLSGYVAGRRAPRCPRDPGGGCRVSAGPEPRRAPVVAMIGMATVDYLYVLEEHPEADSVTPALEYQTAVGGSAGRGAIAAARLGAATRLLATCGTGVHAQVLQVGAGRRGHRLHLGRLRPALAALGGHRRARGRDADASSGCRSRWRTSAPSSGCRSSSTASTSPARRDRRGPGDGRARRVRAGAA